MVQRLPCQRCLPEFILGELLFLRLRRLDRAGQQSVSDPAGHRPAHGRSQDKRRQRDGRRLQHKLPDDLPLRNPSDR